MQITPGKKVFDLKLHLISISLKNSSSAHLSQYNCRVNPFYVAEMFSLKMNERDVLQDLWYIFEEKRINHAIYPPFKIPSVRPFTIAT